VSKFLQHLLFNDYDLRARELVDIPFGHNIDRHAGYQLRKQQPDDRTLHVSALDTDLYELFDRDVYQERDNV
jgi:hypothetical protein